MARRFSASNGVISRLEVQDLRVVNETTTLKWSGRLKNRDISILNSGTTAKLSLFSAGTKGVLGATPFVIASDTMAWSYKINQAGTIQVGVALSTRDLSTLQANNDHVSTQLDVVTGGRVVMLLSPSTLIVEYEERRVELDVTLFTGQTMHPWLSGVVSTGGYSVNINEYQIINMNISNAGVAQINTVTEIESTAALEIDAGDDGIGLGSVNIDSTQFIAPPGEDFSMKVHGGIGITVEAPSGDLQVDTRVRTNAVVPNTGSTLTLSGGGANTVVVDSSGNLTVNPGSVITQEVRAPLGGTTSITNELGVGVQISAGGIVTFDVAPRFNTVQSTAGSSLSLTEGTSGLGISVANSTGAVSVTGPSLTTDSLDATTANVLDIGAGTATKVELARSGVVTEVKGNLDVAEGLDVTGNITVTGTVDGVDIALSTTGLVSVHSDVDITAPANNDTLQYNNGTGTWVNRTLAGAGIAAAGHTHVAADVTDFSTAADARITAQAGVANGLATLDGSGKVPATQLSLAAVTYCGTWNASTNSPLILDGAGQTGCYYVVSVAGSVSVDGIADWVIGDWIIFNGTVWQKVDNTDQVTSVAGKQGAVTLQATDLTDITSAGSGAIITSGERTAITNLATTYLALAGGTMAGSIAMGSNDITGVNALTATGSVSLAAGAVLGTGNNAVTITSGTSLAARAYDIQDHGAIGSLAVVKKSSTINITAYTANTTVVIPGGVTEMEVKLWGSGGHSGIGISGTPGNGGGGGYATVSIPVVPGDTYEITVGAAAAGGAGGLGEPGVVFAHGGPGGGMTTCHHFTGGQYVVKAVAAGGGGGPGSNSGSAFGHGGPGGADATGTGGGKTPAPPPSGGAAGPNQGFNIGTAGTAFVSPAASVAASNGDGGVGATASASSFRSGSGGGGDGYGGGGGGSFDSDERPHGGGGGGNFGDSTVAGTGVTPGNSADPARATYGIATSGNGGLGVFNVTNVGIGGAAIVYLYTHVYSVSLRDDASVNAAAAADVIVRGTDKTAGTGDGGALILRGGTSAGGTAGKVEITGVTNVAPQSEPAAAVAGDVYYDSGTNKLRVYTGSGWETVTSA